MKKDKQLVINIVANVVSFSTTFIISFFLSPYIIANVGKEAQGFVSLANDFVNYMALLTIALNSMASRFIAVKIHQGQQKMATRYFNSVLIGNVIITILLIVPSVLSVFYLEYFLNITSTIINDVKILFAITFISFFVNLISSTFSVAPYVKNRLDLAAVRDVKATFVKAITLVILFMVFKPHVFYVGIAGLLYTIVLLIQNIKYTKQILPEIQIGLKYFDIKCIKEMLSAGIWNVISKISSILATEMSLLISNIAIGDSAMGILAVAKTFPNIILQLIGILASVFTPGFIISYAKADTKTLNKDIQFSMKFIGIFAGIPMTLLIVLGEALLRLWVPSIETNVLYIITIIYGLGMLFAGPVEPLYNVFTITNKVRVPSIYAIITGFLNIVLVLIGVNIAETEMLKMVAIMGTTTVFTIVRTMIFIPLYAAKCLNLRKTVFYPPIIRSVLSSGILSIFGKLLDCSQYVHGWITLIFMSIMFAIMQLVLNFYFFFDKNERKKIIKKIIGTILIRFKEGKK